MCGRYRLSRHKQILAERFDIDVDDDWQPRYNIAPTQSVPVIRQHPSQPKRLCSSMRWGLTPYWSQDASIGGKRFNACGETLSEKPAFRDALRKRRCLIPADGFYEWRKGDKTKIPFCFTMADDSIFAFAGIWDSWRSPEGHNLETFSIITPKPNSFLVSVHDRMPVILRENGFNLWLDPSFQRMDALCDILQPFDASRMRGYEVSSRVNSVKNDDPVCAERVQTLFST